MPRPSSARPNEVTRLAADYLVIGSGATGLAFADTIVERSDRTLVIVDRHDRPGGHWNDAYSFVRLHQPSAFYGVNSLELWDGATSSDGYNAGLLSLASGHEVSAYFERVMRERLLPSGRVTYLPSHDHVGDGVVRPLFGGAAIDVAATTIVDSSYYGTSVPSTHRPKFAVEAGARLATPNDLPRLWQEEATPRHYCILGAGKTAADVALWLLGNGVDADAVTWVRPRDSWFYNRRFFQPGVERAGDMLDGQLALMRAFLDARDAGHLFEALEDAGYMLRIDRDRPARMFHYATCSEAEVAAMGRIRTVLRHGHVRAIGPGYATFDHGREAMPDATLFIDCTARAVAARPPVPQWREGVITLQMVRGAQPAFSAALTAFLDLHLPDDVARNAITRPIPLPDDIAEFPRATLVNLANQQAWMQDPSIRDFVVGSRLDGFSRAIGIAADRDPAIRDKVAAVRDLTRRALPDIQRLSA